MNTSTISRRLKRYAKLVFPAINIDKTEFVITDLRIVYNVRQESSVSFVQKSTDFAHPDSLLTTYIAAERKRYIFRRRFRRRTPNAPIIIMDIGYDEYTDTCYVFPINNNPMVICSVHELESVFAHA